MTEEWSPVFEKTYRSYLDQLGAGKLQSTGAAPGARMDKGEVWTPYFGTTYRVGKKGVSDPRNRRPPFEVCVVLMKYLLLYPATPARDRGWIAYREIPGAGPLTGYFVHDVERLISDAFSGKLDSLQKAALALQGKPSEETFPFDLKMEFQALPEIRLLMLFNDADSEFTARCSVLFNSSAPQFLDPECLAMVGAFLAKTLCRKGIQTYFRKTALEDDRPEDRGVR